MDRIEKELKVSTCVTFAPALASASDKNSYPEAELVTKAQQGDEQAFATLFDLYKKRVYSICLLMTGDAAEAEDSAQDAFIRVFRRLNTFRGDAAFSTWLYRVVVNTVLMKLRKRGLQQVSYDNPICMDSSTVERDFGRTDTQLAGVLDRIALARAIKELPTGYRTVFILHDVQGYEHHEIARMLHCSLGTSKSQLHKARLRIREMLLAYRKTALRKPAHKPRVQNARGNAESLAPSDGARQTATSAAAAAAGSDPWELLARDVVSEMEQTEEKRCA